MSKLYCRSAVLAVIFISLLSPANAKDDGPLVIVITPSAIKQPRSQASTTLTVIEQDTIEQSNAKSVAELLRGQAGLHVSDFFGDGSQATMDLRGFGPTAASNTLILLDGHPLNNATDTAAPDLSMIDIDDIAQIEILQGSAGVLYGNQAVGGVINIIRKQFTQDKASVSLRTGSFGASQSQTSIRKVTGRTKFSVTQSNTVSSGYRDHNETDNQRLSIKVEHRHRSFDSYVELERVYDDRQTPGALLADEMAADRTQALSVYQNDFFATDTDLFRVGLSTTLSESESFNLDYSNRITDREFIQSFRPYPGSLTTQDRDTNNLSAKYAINPVVAERYTNLLFGFNLAQNDYELVSSFGPQAIEQTIQDLYASSEWVTSEASRIGAGIRYSDQQAEIAGNDFDDTVTVFNLTWSWHGENSKVFARADQNYRFPTVEEHTNVSFGNDPGLLTQEGISLEVGTEYQRGMNRYRATLYSIDLDNEIAFDSTGFANLNLDETRRNGMLLETSNQWTRALNTRISATLLDAEITDGAFKGKQLPLVPEQTIRMDMTYAYSPSLLFGLEVIAVNEQVLGGDFANQLDKLPAYEVVNAHLSYDYQHWDFAFRINNVLDEVYSESGSQYTAYDPVTFSPTHYEAYYPSPERNFWMSAKYHF